MKTAIIRANVTTVYFDVYFLEDHESWHTNTNPQQDVEKLGYICKERTTVTDKNGDGFYIETWVLLE